MKNAIQKKLLLILSFLSCCNTSIIAQGEYAGSMKKLIGINYKDSKSIPGLEDYQFREGSLISSLDDPEAITVDVFQKGTSSIAFFSIMEDTSTQVFTIMDLVEVKNVQPGWQLRTAFCRENEVENVEIFALVKSSDSEQYLKVVQQAWRFNRDKRKIQLISIKGIDCVSEGGG